MRILIKNVTLLDLMPSFSVRPEMDVLIENGQISKVGKGLCEQAEKIIDAKDKYLIAGNVCSHHHYYSGLSRGMLISSGPQTDLIQILKEWWWRLDRALDEEAVYYSSLICSIDAVKSGCTSVVDHHASPSFIKGSLDIIKKGMKEVGIRGVTCYEVTDRNEGEKEVREGIDENVRFFFSTNDDPLVRGMIGAHAPFTLPEYAMEGLEDAVNETKAGIHIHVAEDRYDQVYSHHFYNKDIIKRLDDHNLLRDNSLLVHGLYLSDEEIDLLNERGCFFAHNPRSNMNNMAGYNTKLDRIKKLVIGTDGCGADMFEELKIGFFKHRDAKGPFWPADFVSALERGNELVSSAFSGEIQTGQIKEGYKADLVILDYNAPTPVKNENLATHFVWGMSSQNVESVIIDGKLVMEDRKMCFLDEKEIYRKAREVAEKVWKRADKIRS